MKEVHINRFLIEALKITLFCVSIITILAWFNAPDRMLLIAFNMAVLSSAATFSPGGKKFTHLLLGSSAICISIIAGGILGYYFPTTTRVIAILYAGSTFYFSKTKTILTIFTSGTIMFLLFASQPFDIEKGITYSLIAILFIFAFVGFHTLLNSKVRVAPNPLPAKQKITSLIVVISLLIAWIVSHYLFQATNISHIYWMSLMILVLIQGSYQEILKTSLARIGINIVGALFVVLLFNYIVPSNFWINFSLLVLFLFLIFASGKHYFLRSFFIELYVLAFTHLLIGQQEKIAFDRVLLTLLAGITVITVTLITRLFLLLIPRKKAK